MEKKKIRYSCLERLVDCYKDYVIWKKIVEQFEIIRQSAQSLKPEPNFDQIAINKQMQQQRKLDKLQKDATDLHREVENATSLFVITFLLLIGYFYWLIIFLFIYLFIYCSIIFATFLNSFIYLFIYLLIGFFFCYFFIDWLDILIYWLVGYLCYLFVYFFIIFATFLLID